MADAATMTIKAVLLPDEIQATLKDLTFSYTPADANDKWFYGIVNVPHNTGSVDLISGKFLAASAGVATGTANSDITTSDKVKFLFIKNSGTTDGSSSIDESVMLVFDGSTGYMGSTKKKAGDIAKELKVSPAQVSHIKNKIAVKDPRPIFFLKYQKINIKNKKVIG